MERPTAKTLTVATFYMEHLPDLKALDNIHTYDMLCLAETFLTSAMTLSAEELVHPALSCICKDRDPSSGLTRGGLMVMSKTPITMHPLTDTMTLGIEYLAVCIHVNDKYANVVTIYKRPVIRRVSSVHVSYFPYVLYVAKNVGSNIKREHIFVTKKYPHNPYFLS